MTEYWEATSCPRLLVSVRDAAEARAARDGGCDILDVKDPGRGSLGMADANVIDGVIREAGTIDGHAFSPPTSAALGEAVEWPDESRVVRLPPGLGYAKMGLAGLAASADWRSAWGLRRSWFNARAASPVDWVAVVYADWRSALAPRPREIVEAAGDACRVVLFDTHFKNGRSLPDLMDSDEYTLLARRIRTLGLKLAVAGSIRPDHLATFAVCPPDIVAIRSAACVAGKRGGRVCTQRVREFKSALIRTFRSCSR